MTETPDDLPILEPDEMPVARKAPDYQAGIFQRMLCGAPAPFFNPSTSKEYYRFLFAGVLIVLGCFMPFDGDWSHVGYKHASGGVWLIIGLGVIWSMWGAINTGVLRMKWVLLCFLPFIWGLLHLIFFQFPDEKLFPDMVNNWPELFTTLVQKEEGRFQKVGLALQLIGPGKIFIFLGGMLAEVTFVLGIFGGMQKIKEQKATRSAAASSRRSR